MSSTWNQVIDGIDADYQRLDSLEKALDTVMGLLDQAEEAWLEVYDKVAEDLKDEMESAGRKGDPAEHYIASVARRQNRVAYSNYRRAKHARERLAQQIKAKEATLSGRQTHLNALKADGTRQAQGQHPHDRAGWQPRAA